MTQTLDRERRQKFMAILEAWYQDNPPTQHATEHNKHVTELLVAAAKSNSEKFYPERKTDETAAEYNTELFKGDWRQYPEHLQETARVLRDVWKFVLPAKPQKKTKEFSKGAYKMFCFAMEQVKQSCGEMGVEKVLTALHEDWIKGFKNGIAPYTIAQPASLVNVAAGKAREMRDSVGITQKTDFKSNHLERDL